MEQRTPRVDHLDGIRAIAITGVLGVHWAATYLPVGVGGVIGVDVFFVLSGFIITTVLWRWRGDGGLGREYREFLRRRVRRLYPALCALCVVTPLIWLLLSDPPVALGDVTERSGLALVQLTWLPEALGHTMDPFRQTWSLAIEWYFYLLWAPVVLWLRRRVPASRLLRWTALAAVLLWVVPALTLSLPWFYFGPPVRFAELLAGAALALAMQADPGLTSRVRTPEWLAGLAIAAVAAYVLLAPNPGEASEVLRWVGTPLAVGAALVLVWHGYAVADGPTLRLLRWGPVALLGRVSYSLYLWHWLPVYLLDKDQIGLPAPLLGALGIAVAAVLTALSYVLVERPFLGNRSDALAPTTVRVA